MAPGAVCRAGFEVPVIWGAMPDCPSLFETPIPADPWMCRFRTLLDKATFESDERLRGAACGEGIVGLWIGLAGPSLMAHWEHFYW